MPAVPAIIAVAGTIAAAKIQSDSNKRAINANKDTTNQALDYEKQRNADKQARYDKAMEQWRSDRNAYYKHFFGFDPDEGKAPAGPAGAAPPITTGGTYAPGYGPGTTPGAAPTPGADLTKQGGPGMMQPLDAPAAPAMSSDTYLQRPRGNDIGSMIGAPAMAPTPLALPQQAPSATEAPGGMPMVPGSIASMGGWNDPSRLGLQNPQARRF